MKIDATRLAKLRECYQHGDYAQLEEFSKQDGAKGRGWRTFKNAIDSGKCSPKTLEIMLKFYTFRKQKLDAHAGNI